MVKVKLSQRQKELLVWIERSSEQQDGGEYWCPAIGHMNFVEELDDYMVLYWPRDGATLASLEARGLTKRVFRGDLILPRYASRITEEGASMVRHLVQEGFCS